jgi:hypothetical protein
MTYQYENLDDERFQEFCQALLAREYLGLQCLPVGQPDGGRDMFIPHPAEPRRGVIIFQVKFRRQASTAVDPVPWLQAAVAGELPKIKRLAEAGASRYVLLTNVPGSAHYSTGQVDRLQRILDETVPIPAQCLWRADLDRRLDGAWDLKWVYTDLMSGPDVVRALLEAGLGGEERNRRSAAMTAFIRTQYDKDKEVRFKQIELTNKLLDLFIDVPAIPRGGPSTAPKDRFEANQIIEAAATSHYKSALQEAGSADMIDDRAFHRRGFYASADGPILIVDEDFPIGGATLLLHPEGQRRLDRLVLEGAPGQGKSTLVQYLCQIHRMKFLNLTADLAQVPQNHRTCPARIPFKVDLRDLATWLRGENPLVADDNVPATWAKSVESLLAAQVEHYSGGVHFDVADLLAVCQASPILLVLDGLDEVADIGERKTIVEVATASVSRLAEATSSLQVVITSRPAAFANSPGFPHGPFRYWVLANITRPLILGYTERWITARALGKHDAADVRSILREKLNQPHMRDLARNPMQLAILLSLIHSIGTSLPDKRTALYDTYVDKFFNRESEKSPVVRSNRQLLIDIHQHLAWSLHAEAESGRSRGSIRLDSLQDMVRRYLKDTGRRTDLVDTLFHGMLERVVFLVSRVEGTYEFEVQPLREYFAARHLYQTAPYSPPGNPRQGTKPQRFNAIARNFYWLNVTRFFAGCYSSGELADLVMHLQDLQEESDFARLFHPRTLAAMLLNDWVFTQTPRGTAKIVDLVFDDLGIRTAFHSSTSQRSEPSGVLRLPEECGRPEASALLKARLDGEPGLPNEVALEICLLLAANEDLDSLFSWWYDEARRRKGLERMRWLRYGQHMRLASKLSVDEANGLIKDDPKSLALWQVILDAGLAEVVDATESHAKTVLDGVLSGRLTYRWDAKTSRSPVLELGAWLDTELLSMRMSGFIANSDYTRKPWSDGETGLSATVRLAAAACGEVSNLPPLADDGWENSLSNWSNMVESIRTSFGECWLAYEIANIAAGIRSRKERGGRAAILFDANVPLCTRSRHTRMRRKQQDWWQAQYGDVENRLECMFWLLSVLSWADPLVVSSLMQQIEESCNRLTADDILVIVGALKRISFSREVAFRMPRTQDRRLSVSDIPPTLSMHAGLLVATRATRDARAALMDRYLDAAVQTAPLVAGQFYDYCLDEVSRRPGDWAKGLSRLRMLHLIGGNERVRSIEMAPHGFPRDAKISPDLVREILDNPFSYPYAIVAFGESVLRRAVAPRIVPVARTAESEGWAFS